MPVTACIYRALAEIFFFTQPIAESGLKIRGDSRKIITLESGEKQYFAVGVNDQKLQLIKLCNEGKQ
jgi:hypothetical protein